MKSLAVLGVAALTLGLVACGGEEKAASTESAAPQQAAASAEQQKFTPSAPPQATNPEPAAAVTQQDLANHPGKALHDANCISCHDSGVYTRADRSMKDFPMLAGQVRRCDANLGTRLFDEDMDNIAAYLNAAYYQFPPDIK